MRLIRNCTTLINADCIASCDLIDKAIMFNLVNGKEVKVVYFKNKEHLKSDFADLEIYLTNKKLKYTLELKGD